MFLKVVCTAKQCSITVFPQRVLLLFTCMRIRQYERKRVTIRIYCSTSSMTLGQLKCGFATKLNYCAEQNGAEAMRYMGHFLCSHWANGAPYCLIKYPGHCVYLTLIFSKHRLVNTCTYILTVTVI